MRVELVSLCRDIIRRKRIDVVSDVINKSKSDLVLFCGHSVFDWNDCVELSERVDNKESLVLFEAKKVDERPMGNQGKMEKRRELLSSNKRYYFSTSNSDEKHLIDSSSLQYSFYDGNRLNSTSQEINKDAQIRIFDID